MPERLASVNEERESRRDRIVRLSHIEGYMLGAVLQARGTAVEANIHSALASVLNEYHNEVMAYIGELALAGHKEKPATGAGGA